MTNKVNIFSEPLGEFDPANRKLVAGDFPRMLFGYINDHGNLVAVTRSGDTLMFSLAKTDKSDPDKAYCVTFKKTAHPPAVLMTGDLATATRWRDEVVKEIKAIVQAQAPVLDDVHYTLPSAKPPEISAQATSVHLDRGAEGEAEAEQISSELTAGRRGRKGANDNRDYPWGRLVAVGVGVFIAGYGAVYAGLEGAHLFSQKEEVAASIPALPSPPPAPAGQDTAVPSTPKGILPPAPAMTTLTAAQVALAPADPWGTPSVPGTAFWDDDPSGNLALPLPGGGDINSPDQLKILGISS